MPLRAALALFLALSLAGCGGEKAPEGPLTVSVIGPEPRFAAVGRDEAPAPQTMLLSAVAQGLVSRDAEGRIEPGLAERWIVSDDGLSYIFRLRRAEWSHGKPVTAEALARNLRALVAPRGGNRLAPYFSAVEEVVAVTPEILEIRLRYPRPHLMDLLAQPEMAMLNGRTGAGPFRLAARNRGAVTLQPIADPLFPETQQAHRPVILRGERAAVALVRYQRGGADAVLGGTFDDLPVARAAAPPAQQLRIDPARGLFGLAVVNTRGFLESPENRMAVSMALDRDRITGAFALPGWQPVASIVPAQLEMPAGPALPGWTAQPAAERIALARARVLAWRGQSTEPVRLSISLPQGPGGRLLFALIALDLERIGIVAERASSPRDADLRLIDAVAPNDSATWFLTRLSCANGFPCDETADRALAESRALPTLAERAAKLAEVDARYEANVPFIPIATPLRWSVVKPGLRGFRPNVRAVHPLNRLLND